MQALMTKATAAAALLLATSASGTEPAASRNEPAHENAQPVTLRWITIAAIRPGVDALVKAFNDSHPNIKVQVTYAPNPQIPQIIGTQMQGGNPPDLIPATPGSGIDALSVHALGKAGKLVDLSNQPFTKIIPGLLRPLVSVDGKIYAFPISLSTVYFGYTVPVFEKFRITPPATWNELLRVCKTLRANDSYAMADGLGAPNSNLFKMQAFAASNVYAKNPNWDQDRAAGKVTFAGTPGWHQVFQQVVDMINADCFYPGYAGRKWEGTLQLLAQDKAHMGIHPSGSWMALHQASPGRVIGTSAIPGDQATALPITSGTALSVASGSKHIPQAIAFLAYASQHLAEYSKNTGGISPVDFAAGRLPSFLAPLEPLARQGKFSIAAGMNWPSAAVTHAGELGMTGLATGQTTIAEILANMDKAWDSSQSRK